MSRLSRPGLTLGLLGMLVAVFGGVLLVPGSRASVTSVPVQVSETTGNQSRLLASEPDLTFTAGTGNTSLPTIVVNDASEYQQMAGFGAAMTDSSAYVLMHDMSSSQRAGVMSSLFSASHGIGLDYVRVPIGANDFATSDYTEDDMPAGDTDPTLAHFSIAHDLENIIPALQQALAINPNIELLASPWSAPAWMKTNGSLDGGSLNPADDAVYAAYLVKFVQAYAAKGIHIAALTVQNEPDDPEASYPGMTLTAAQESAIVPILAEDLKAAGLSTQILGFDSDWSDSSFASSLLSSPVAAPYLAGTAFHCYAGDPSAQLAIQAQDPTLGIYETECSGIASYPSFAGNLVSATNTLVINGIRDDSKTVLLWNMALDQNDGPTNGGCLDCVPNVTINNTTGAATYNVEYYILGQISRFVEPGAYRVASTDLGEGSIETVAFKNPNGSDVLIALNTSGSTQTYTIRSDGQSTTATIPSGAVQTLTWTPPTASGLVPRATTKTARATSRAA